MATAASFVASGNATEDCKTLGPLVADLLVVIKKTGKADGPAVAEAINAATNLANTCMVPAEAHLLTLIPALLEQACSKVNPVKVATKEAMAAICGNMSANAVGEVLPMLFAASVIAKNWQVRTLAYDTIARFGDHAPEQLGCALPAVVPEVTVGMADTKKQVKVAAAAAMSSACDVIGNRDIEHMTVHILRSITNPEEVKEIMHKLAGVTFAQSVQSPALAMVVPLLIRGLRSRITATIRQSAVIIDNMSKLVDDPVDAAPLLPILVPALVFASETVSDPEARGVLERASHQMNLLQEQISKLIVKEIEHPKVLAALDAQLPAGAKKESSAVVRAHIAHLMCSLMALKQFETEAWEEVTTQLGNLVPAAAAAAAVTALLPVCKEMCKVELAPEDDGDDAEELCNCQFTLAYGTKILLHNVHMRLKRGHKYGLLGGNDSGKTTLMRSIAQGSIDGFPDRREVRTVFVEADILGELSHLSCLDYIMADERLAGLDKEEVLSVMATVGFKADGKAKPLHAVSTLSGGWRMKLAMARAMLQRADILLLDEPTNHLDVINVQWVKNYINSLTNVTCIMVSHDSGFLNDCCTDILQINRLKLNHYRGNLDSFIERNPEARAYFALKESKAEKFQFPQPGHIEGVRARSTALMKMDHITFTYPGNDAPTLFDCSVRVSMASRVGCVGENGAGKSTMVKVLTGEVVPQEGTVWKHPNARVAYVAQHAFHHIEEHLDKTPNEYIRWRYASGEDKESLVKVSMVLTPEEEALQLKPFELTWVDADSGKTMKAKKTVASLTGDRRFNKKAKENEYEVRYREGGTGYLGYKQLGKLGWTKNCNAIDTRIAQRAGMYVKTLSSTNVEQHLAGCGLQAEFASHYRMSALSGGQKVKVVLAACMWNNPHILILDEPTNYLDRESLGALAQGIESYEGGVVIISHNNEFVSTLCTSEWVMDAGHLTTKGASGWMDRQDDKIAEQEVITEMTDSHGNTVKVKAPKKQLSKREVKAKIKKVKKMIQKGEELDSDDEEFAIENELFA
jgi:elongation factor 3